MRSNLLNTRTIDYQELIGNGKRYRVPPYQRDYSWSVEQWEDLWNDLEELHGHAEKQHYLGALVVEAGKGREFLVIDGQQRLATLSLLALAVIDKLGELAASGIEADDNAERGVALRNRFIGEKDPATLTESSRLILNETDNAFYQDYLVQLRRPRNERGLRGSNELLWNCFKYFRSKLDEGDYRRRDGREIAGLLSETVARQLLFILISVDDELNAYTVFETLNARGLELTTTDLIKNYLFSRVRAVADQEALRRRWRDLLATVDPARFPVFLRYHLLCKQPKVRGERLFKLVRDRTVTAEDVFALLDALERRSELFAALSDPRHDYWADPAVEAAKKHIRELVLFRTSQATPLLFAAWEALSEADFVRVLRLVSVISFRYSVIAKRSGNDLEPVYHHAAKAVRHGEATTPADVFAWLRAIYIDDATTRRGLARLVLNGRGHGRPLAKYILARLEEDAAGRACDPDTDPSTVEHILPRNPGGGWEEFPTNHQEAFASRLGNLTLLEPATNKRIGNAPYVRKVVAYGLSSYELTRQVAVDAPEAWTPEHIEARQKRLARRGVHVWRVDYAEEVRR